MCQHRHLDPPQQLRVRTGSRASADKVDCTLFPAEAGLSQNPELVVVKVDLSSGWQEGMCKFPIQPIKAWVQWRPPAVCVVKGVEAWQTNTHTQTDTCMFHKRNIRLEKTETPFLRFCYWCSFLPIMMSALLLGFVISLKERGDTSLHLVNAMLIALRVSSLFRVLGNLVILTNTQDMTDDGA